MSWGQEEVFELETGRKRARTVVLATGASAPATLSPNNPFQTPENNAGNGSVAHAFDTPLLPASFQVRAKKQTSLAVIGAGLTSAQITCLAISLGVSKVHHLIRSTLKVKHFDVDLGWVGKYKNFHLASF